MGEKVTLTGATGFLGSHLMAALLKRGRKLIILGRASEEGNLAQRIADLLAWFGLEELNGQIEAKEVDLLNPFLGLNGPEYHELCAGTDLILHCASDTRFSESRRRESMDANVRSLDGIIGLAKDSAVTCFHYISTAYVNEPRAELCPEAPVSRKIFANVYEETKAMAEHEVASRLGSYAIPFTIVRPSIVYGDSRTGRSNRFNALYYHVKSLYYIREIYVKEIRERGGRKARECGIHLDEHGVLHVPLRIFLAEPGYINLIPIDYFVSAALSILDHPDPGGIYHITGNDPSTPEALASYCEMFLKMKGIRIEYGSAPHNCFQNPPEALFNRFIEPYRPYLSDTRTFERSNTNRVTSGLFPPPFTYPIFERCMDYALRASWGNRKKSET
jgi:nucleoside-diphosphate-sugar epimerase